MPNPPPRIGSVEVAQQYDVVGRLAEGREAVAHTQTYVSACYRLGYRHPDLTGYDGQLADRYDSEAGLDLRLLDADCAALVALADAADDALRQQRTQFAEFSTAWRGPGADAATEFLRGHCDAGARLTARLRAAAGGCAGLRDELWRLVDAKAAAVLAVDDRVGGVRAAWLTAAHAVSSGADNRHAAEVIEKQVIPYVDNDVRGEWVSAVRSTRDGAAAAYGSAAAAADPAPGVVFAIPGDLGPVAQFDGPPPVAPIVTPSAPPPLDASLDAPDVSAERPAAPAAPRDDVPDNLGAPPGLGLPGDLGLPAGGLPIGGSGLGGLIPRLADAFGDPGLGEQFNNPFEDTSGTDEHDPDEPEDFDDPEPDPAVEAAAEDDNDDDAGEEPEPDDTATAEEADTIADPEPVPIVAETGEIEEPEPTPDAPPKTPCEIAAEELPQVGP